MFKIAFCLRRRPDPTPERFDSDWRDTHAPPIRRHAAAPGIRRCVQSTRFESGLAAADAKVRNAPAPFDGAAELRFDSREAMQAGFSAEPGRAAGREIVGGGA